MKVIPVNATENINNCIDICCTNPGSIKVGMSVVKPNRDIVIRKKPKNNKNFTIGGAHMSICFVLIASVFILASSVFTHTSDAI